MFPLLITVDKNLILYRSYKLNNNNNTNAYTNTICHI